MGSEAPGEGGSTVVVVEFSLTDPEYPFVGLSAAEGCSVSLERMLPRGEGEHAEFFSVLGADTDRVRELGRANDHVEPILIDQYDDGGLFEFTVEGFYPARSLAEVGAIPRTVESDDGRGVIVAEVPPGESATTVNDSFLDEHPSAALVSKQTTDRLTPCSPKRTSTRLLGSGSPLVNARS